MSRCALVIAIAVAAKVQNSGLMQSRLRGFSKLHSPNRLSSYRSLVSSIGSSTKKMSDAPAAKKKEKPSTSELVKAAMVPSPAPLVEIGINLDRDDVIERARSVGVSAMIVTGTSVKNSAAACEICNQTTNYPLYFTAGVHPHDAKSCDETTLASLREIASDPKCVAIGECGLDFNRNFSPPDVQEIWFDAQ
eukprot:gene2695-16096_t